VKKRFQLALRDAFDESSLADGALRAALAELADDPGKVLERLLGAGST
jgi:hypothetical protein